jgi:hypothetical protein
VHTQHQAAPRTSPLFVFDKTNDANILYAYQTIYCTYSVLASITLIQASQARAGKFIAEVGKHQRFD